MCEHVRCKCVCQRASTWVCWFGNESGIRQSNNSKQEDHNYIGHEYIGHSKKSLVCKVHTCTGRTCTGHNYIGHSKHMLCEEVTYVRADRSTDMDGWVAAGERTGGHRYRRSSRQTEPVLPCRLQSRPLTVSGAAAPRSAPRSRSRRRCLPGGPVRMVHETEHSVDNTVGSMIRRHTS